MSASASSATARATRRSCKVIKEAEQRLLETQETKAYLGSAGDKRFAELLRPILLGEHAGDERIAGLADAGRLRRASARLRADRGGQPERARVRRRADLAQPSADHPRGRARGGRISLLRARAGRDPLRGHDRRRCERREPGDVALLHGCCHNPTGADLERGPVARGRRGRRRARADPVRRHRLPGLRPRPRRGCVRRRG